jgi:hypothetical protein
VCDLVEAALTPNDNAVVGSDYSFCSQTLSVVYRWKYPAGGYPTNNAVLGSESSEPAGAAVSEAAPH